MYSKSGSKRKLLQGCIKNIDEKHWVKTLLLQYELRKNGHFYFQFIILNSVWEEIKLNKNNIKMKFNEIRQTLLDSVNRHVMKCPRGGKFSTMQNFISCEHFPSLEDLLPLDDKFLSWTAVLRTQNRITRIRSRFDPELKGSKQENI